MEEEYWNKIELVGFSEYEPSTMHIIKKSIGTAAKHIFARSDDIQEFKITNKVIREKETSEMYEVHILIIDKGQRYAASITDRSLPLAVEKVVNKIENSLDK